MNKLNLESIYKNEIIPSLKEKYGNVHKIPKLNKIVINLGIKKLISSYDNALNVITKDIQNICCQKPFIVKSKKSCDSFSIKQG